jgi:hypothetical protein
MNLKDLLNPIDVSRDTDTQVDENGFKVIPAKPTDSSGIEYRAKNLLIDGKNGKIDNIGMFNRKYHWKKGDNEGDGVNSTITIKLNPGDMDKAEAFCERLTAILEVLVSGKAVDAPYVAPSSNKTNGKGNQGDPGAAAREKAAGSV